MSPGRWREPGRVGCVTAGCGSPSRGSARVPAVLGRLQRKVGSCGEAHTALSLLSQAAAASPSSITTFPGTRCQWERWRGNWVQKPPPHLPADPRPRVLVLPKEPERFPRCRQWAGRVARCVPMPAAGRGARTGLCGAERGRVLRVPPALPRWQLRGQDGDKWEFGVNSPGCQQRWSGA